MPNDKKIPKKPGASTERKGNAKRGTLHAKDLTGKTLRITKDSAEEFLEFENSFKANTSNLNFSTNPNLNLLEAAFLSKYVRHFNATRALKEIGYESSGGKTKLNQFGYILKNRLHVRQAIKDYFEKNERKDRDAERQWVAEVKKLAFGNLDDLASWTEDGEVKFTSSEDLDEGARSLPESIKQTTQYDKYGEVVKQSIELKKESKESALKMLGAYYGWTGTNPVDVDKGRTGLSAADRAAISRELADSVAELEQRGTGRPDERAQEG